MPDGPVATSIDGPTAWVRIERAAALNALSPDVLAGLDAAVFAAVDARCSVLVLRGAGGTLSAGADLKHLRSISADPAAVRDYITAIGAVVERLADAPLVSVAVVEKFALAGGCEILLACDLSVVSDQARIGDRHLEYGLLPGAGGSVRLARSLPPALARRLLYTGEMLDGATAGQIGLVSHAVPAAEVDATVTALAARLVRHAPAALTAMKRLYRSAASDGDLAAALAHERETLLDYLSGEPCAAEGLAAFAERRPPDFTQFRYGGSAA